ncbi:MAG TPA: acyltransferase [Planctomycetaceae bacterium]|nr:acyltransferase [Planctomycetaceae bacterium]
MSHTHPGFAGRSTFIDALRGIAALGVACYHIDRYGPLPEAAGKFIPLSLQAVLDHGWIGVQVFFVISGFVIAYSVRSARVTPGYLANYALRRSIRLDPPYWSTIAFVLLLHAVLHLHLGFDSPLDVPTKLEPALSWQLLASHLFYLQNILDYDNLSAGFWTLCIEVQFYLLYVVGQGIAQRFPHRNRHTPADASPIGLIVVFAPLALLSLFVWNRGIDLWDRPFDNEMWIIRFFCMFFLGASAWWALDGRIPRWLFWLYAAAFASRILLQAQWSGWSDDLTIGLSAALAAGLSTYAAGRLGRLGTWLDYGVLQYLGRISYSLYLIHFPMSHVVTTLGSQVLGENPGPALATLWLVLALVASLGAAHLLYRFVEAPSVRLAARLKRAPAAAPRTAPAATPAPATAATPAAATAEAAVVSAPVN